MKRIKTQTVRNYHPPYIQLTSTPHFPHSRPNLRLAGSEALLNLSLESGFRHWHGDMEVADKPREAGLQFLCNAKLKEGTDFVGRYGCGI